MSKQDTKQQLLVTGTEVVSQQGYGSTGLNEILAAAHVPKGSFYYYFDSKEDFGLQIVDYYVRRHRDLMKQFLEDESMAPLTRMRRYYEAFTALVESAACKRGCLIGNLGQEMSAQSEPFRLKIDATMTAVMEQLVKCLTLAQQAGEISEDANIQELAEFCYSSWQGAVLRTKVTQSTAPLKVFTQMIFDNVLKK